MNGFNRGTVSVTADVDVSAVEFWDLVRDWSAVMKWIPEDRSVPVLNVTLKEGNDLNVLPCTRVMHLDASKGFPPTIDEILLYADPQSKRLFYTFSGIPDGLTNYIATTFVDELEGDRARVTCASMFDVPVSLSLAKTVSWLEHVYEYQMIRGMESAIKRERQASEK
jgi:hypothetical protein